jgi:hypothetical protein
MEGAHDPDCRRCMPWDEIDSGKLDERINDMKALIEMRKSLQSCKSRNFHFPDDVPEERVITYLKLGEKESIRVYLNCEKKDVKLDVSETGDVIYSRKWKAESKGSGVLGKDGILITSYR